MAMRSPRHRMPNEARSRRKATKSPVTNFQVLASLGAGQTPDGPADRDSTAIVVSDSSRHFESVYYAREAETMISEPFVVRVQRGQQRVTHPTIPCHESS